MAIIINTAPTGGPAALGPLRVAVRPLTANGTQQGAQVDQVISGLGFRPRVAIAIATDVSRAGAQGLFGAGSSVGFQSLTGAVSDASVGKCLQFHPAGPSWRTPAFLCSASNADGTRSGSANIIAVTDGTVTVRFSNLVTPVNGAQALSGVLILIGN